MYESTSTRDWWHQLPDVSRPDAVFSSSASDALEEITKMRALRRRATLAEFQLAAEYAELSGREAMIREGARAASGMAPVMHGERLSRMAGDGTPLVAEFASLELGPRLRLTPDAAWALMRDALAAKYRLPGIWALLKADRLEVWQARTLADLVRGLDAEQAAWLDSELSPRAAGMSPTRLEAHARALVRQLRSDEANDERDRDRARRRVEFTSSENGHTTGLMATLDAADAIGLDAQVDRLAEIFKRAGDSDTLEVRRAKALGVLGTPARALQLIQASLLDELPALVDEGGLDLDCPALGQRGHTCGTITVHPDRLLPKAEIRVHLSDATLRDADIEPDALVRVEALGPQLVSWLADLVGHTRIALRPVLTVDSLRPSDSYEVPTHLREAIQVRNPLSVFPFSKKQSESCDVDHTLSFARNGPPGQTATNNLGPLDRRAHRAKTRGGWKLDQPIPGCFLWTSPRNHRYLVTPSCTVVLDHEDFIALPDVA
ncbi:hypothetical protein [Aestuariimicrobium sp. T2.26MG-19.2B]|uniref:hypothetical protein n=1 Tax=Aestuariimicrobium sp. T2.26MG-19.2B TaxID=3040679 RepID=UPI002477BB98|nr:hypothetical protein [Aestuariimicrobium sp. T2.26MG-19.2B]CAI9409946.1 hypothetical protein AESSP_02338 [Aestuariimicrobium sp. T2.26MG-19.2B]